MSNGNRFNESPNHFMVLDAIARGMKKVSSIAKVTKLSKDEVELIVNDLNSVVDNLHHLVCLPWPMYIRPIKMMMH